MKDAHTIMRIGDTAVTVNDWVLYIAGAIGLALAFALFVASLYLMHQADD